MFPFVSFCIRAHLIRKLMHHTVFSLKEMRKNNNKAYGKSQICIENAKIKKPRKSAHNKIIISGSDFLGNANFVPISKIYDLPP